MSANKPVELCSQEELDREIKELTVKKMRSEILEINERRCNQELCTREKEERLKFFSSVNNQFGNIITALNKFIKGDSVTEEEQEKEKSKNEKTLNGKQRLLEDAYNEAVSGLNSE